MRRGNGRCGEGQRGGDGGGRSGGGWTGSSGGRNGGSSSGRAATKARQRRAKKINDAKNTSSRGVGQDNKRTKEELETSAGQQALSAKCDSADARSNRRFLLSNGEAGRRASVWSIARERKTKRAQWLRDPHSPEPGRYQGLRPFDTTNRKT